MDIEWYNSKRYFLFVYALTNVASEQFVKDYSSIDLLEYSNGTTIRFNRLYGASKEFIRRVRFDGAIKLQYYILIKDSNH